MLTTIFPLKIPAGVQGILVLNMGTFRPSSIWRTGTPTSKSPDSKEKLQPMRKLTKSSCQNSSTLVYSPASSPFR